MAEWKKVLVSGSNIEVNQITGSGDADIQGTLSLPDISDVSASLAAAIAGTATAGDGIFVNGNIVSVDSASLATDMAGDFITATNGTLNLATSIGTLGTTEFTGSYTGSFTGDGSGLTGVAPAAGDGIFVTGTTVSVDSGSLIIKADNTEIQSSILTNQTVGGISSGESFSAGTDVEDLLRQILISYIQPTVNLDHIRNNGSNLTTVREVGEDFVIDQIQYDAAADDPNGNLIQNVGFASTGADTNFALSLGTNPLTAGNNQLLTISPDQSITKTSTGTVTFTISGSDLNNAVVSDTRNVVYRIRTVFGGSSVDLGNSSQQSTDVQTIYNAIKSQRSSLTATSADFSTTGTTATDNSSNYTYYMYNAGYADLAEYTQAGFTNSIGGAYTKIGTTFTVTNDENESVSLKVYQSVGTQAVNNNQAIVFID